MSGAVAGCGYPQTVLRRLLRREVRHARLWPFVIGAVVVVGALIVAWQVYEAREESRIRPGATVSGVEIGGLEPEEAVTALEPVVQEVADTIVDLQFQDHTITVTAAELGISLDAERTLAEADNPPPPVVRPAAWLFDLFASRDVRPSITTDLGTLTTTVDPYTDPETPRIDFTDGTFYPVLSTDVPVPDMELLTRRLEEAVLSNVGGHVTVEVPIQGMEPADPIAVALATALATRANEITAGGISLRLEGTDQTLSIGELALRQFIVFEGEQHDTHLALDSRIAGTLASLFVGIGGEGTPATIGIDEAGAVTISGGEAGFKCCHPSVVDVLLAGMMEHQPMITLPATPAPHPRGREWAESLGILQVVGEFTTNFKPGQDRVLNIARISELTRGAIMEPGGRFSVNDFVGPRTVGKGFVPAGMILNGVFVDSVGGGISQYATTVFNAAFFAGLDFVNYQSHTIYLSRYPYGREATVSYPAPDLVLENSTPYGVMLWPTTDDTSITVRLYSTPWVLAEQTNQWTRAVGTSCTRVTTERTRTYLEDGRAETDTVGALYRPEGIRCDGTPSVTTTTTTTTTTTPTTTTTTTTTTTAPPEESEYQGSDEAEPQDSQPGTDDSAEQQDNQGTAGQPGHRRQRRTAGQPGHRRQRRTAGQPGHRRQRRTAGQPARHRRQPNSRTTSPAPTTPTSKTASPRAELATLTAVERRTCKPVRPTAAASVRRPQQDRNERRFEARR